MNNMERTLKLYIIIVTITLASCGKKKIEPNYGKTTSLELTQLLGVPAKEEVVPVENTKIYHYSSGDKYQVEKNIVTNGFLVPKENEMTLIYWKHAFKDCETTTENLTQNKQGHEASEFLLKCQSLGVGVVYSEYSNVISKVIKYEKK